MGYLRSTHIVDDIQLCFYALLKKMQATVSPWTSWDIILGFPEEEVFNRFEKPIIYIMRPVQISKIKYQGATMPLRYWRLTLGAWLERKHGGTEELNIISSQIMNLFENSKLACRDIAFDITLGDTTYTDTNLADMGILIDGVDAERSRFDFIDEKDFRSEWDLIIVA